MSHQFSQRLVAQERSSELPAQCWTLVKQALSLNSYSCSHLFSHMAQTPFWVPAGGLSLWFEAFMLWPVLSLPAKNRGTPDSSRAALLCFRVIWVFEVQNMKPLLYNTLKCLLLRLPFFTLLSFSLKLHISLLSGGKKAVVLQQISPFPPPQHQRWLEGEAHFPESRVSQLTKNVSFPLRIRSRLTELRNFLDS